MFNYQDLNQGYRPNMSNSYYQEIHPVHSEARVEYVNTVSVGEKISISRNENIQDLELPSKGKYTSRIFNHDNDQNRKTIVTSNTDFNFDHNEANYCTRHSEIKDYFLMSKVEGFKLLDTICKNCLSQINHRNPNPARADLFDTIIFDNKDKIIQIKENKLNLSGSSSSETLGILKDTVLPLADELINLSELFYNQICGKISGNTARAEEVAKLKNFINSIELDINGDPILNGIGRNENLKHKYIKLALFLTNFTGLSNDGVDHRGITESLKIHLSKMIALRKIIVTRITSWLKYLSGGFYDNLFNLEGLPVDENFRKNLKIDYVSEDEIFKIKAFYEGELFKRDERISFLEDENLRFKKEIESLRESFKHFSESDRIITELKAKLHKAEGEIAYLNQNMTMLSNDNQRLNKLNIEYLNQIDVFRKEIAQLKFEFEGKLRNTIETMKIDFDKRFTDNLLQFNQLKGKYSELENKYNLDTHNISKEKEQLVLQIKAMENDMKGSNSLLHSLSKERDDLRTQLYTLHGDMEKQTKEFNIINNLKISYESRIAELQKKIEELSGFYTKLQTEYNSKITIINNLENKIKDLGGVVSSSENQISFFGGTVKKLEAMIEDLKKQNDDLKIKMLVISEKDNEISKLKLALASCRDEWNKLSEAYEGLLVDIRSQISVNESLRSFIYELQSKIESHNQQVGGLDVAIRQQLELLTRQTLAKKSIEYKQNDTVIKSQNEADALRVKLGRIESAKLTKSAVFTNVGISLDDDSNDNKRINIVKNTVVSGTFNDHKVSDNSGYGKYYSKDNSTHQQTISNTNNNYSTNYTKVVSIANENISYGNSNYKTSINYEAPKYVSNPNDVTLNLDPPYNYKGTYDRTYGNDVINSLYGDRKTSIHLNDNSPIRLDNYTDIKNPEPHYDRSFLDDIGNKDYNNQSNERK